MEEKECKKVNLISFILLMIIIIGVIGVVCYSLISNKTTNTVQTKTNNVVSKNSSSENDEKIDENNIKDKDTKSEEDTTRTEPVIENSKDYSEYYGTWSDNNMNEFTIKKISNDLITFTWFIYRIASIDDVTLPLKDDTAVFYFHGYSDKNFNGQKEDDEYYYRKATVELKENGILVTVENTTSTEFIENISLDKSNIFGGNSYIEAGKYNFMTQKTKVELKTNQKDYSNYYGTWSDNKDEFTIKDINNDLITFTWFIYRIASIDDVTLPLKDDKAVFYFHGYSDKNFNGQKEEDEYYYRKATVELKENGISVTVENTTSTDFIENMSLDKSNIFGGNSYIEAGKYNFTTKK